MGAQASVGLFLGLLAPVTAAWAQSPPSVAPSPSSTPSSWASPASPPSPALVAAAPAEPRPSLELWATFSPGSRQIGGVARWVIPNLSQRPISEVSFWLYPNRLGERHAALGDVNFHWLYPYGFSPAAMRIGGARVEGHSSASVNVQIASSAAGPDSVARVVLPAAVAPGASVTISLDFMTDLPVRLGGFGCADRKGNACRMMGGFYPFPFHLGPAGFEAESPPDRARYVARVVVPAGRDVFLGDVQARSTGAEIVASDEAAAYVAFVVDGGLRAESVESGPFRATFFHHGARPPSSAADVLPYVREDRTGLVLDAIRQALNFLEPKLGAQARTEVARRPLVFVEAKLRHELVQVHRNVVLVSDRLFEIFPIDRLRRMHRLELTRAIITAVINRWTTTVEPDRDVDLSSEVLAAQFTELFAQGKFRRREFVPDLLRPFSFIPAVDQLIHAPLVASSASYFGDPQDRDLVRDDVRRFSHRRGGGRLVESKLVDLLGRPGMERVAGMVLAEGVPLRKAAEQVFGASLDWFWRQWADGPPPPVNYRLVAVSSAPGPGPGQSSSAAAAHSHVTIDVRREGGPVSEPVEVRVVDRAGHVHDLVWSPGGDRHRFELDLPAGLASVEIDPRRRLIESAVGSLDSADDPRVDNRKPRTWRWLYSGAGALLDVTSLTATFAAAVTLKPTHDLRNAMRFVASHSPAVRMGVESAYTRLFGPQADKNRLARAAGIGVSAALLEPSFGVAPGETDRPLWRLSGGIFTENDNRGYFVDPWSAVGFNAGVSYALTGLQDGSRLSQVSGTFELLRLFELAPGHVAAIDLQGGATLGDLRVRSQLGQIGGPTALRGYAPGELFGQGQLVARVELRNRYVSDLDWNLAHFTSVRGLGGNLFFETGLVTSCDGLSAGSSDIFTDVGYSLRVLHDAFGVYQQLFSIDLAVPLNRHDRACKGWHSLGPPGEPDLQIRRPAFVVLVSFLPAF